LPGFLLTCWLLLRLAHYFFLGRWARSAVRAQYESRPKEE
jgi:hypothetical protein